MNRILIGDCRDTMRDLIAQCVKVQCVITSPPYFGLRSYLPVGHPLKSREIGQERFLDCLAWARRERPCGACYICTMREVFGLVRDVLVDDGTLWIVQGDSYYNGDNGAYQPNIVKATDSLQANNLANDIRGGGANRWPQPGLKPKDLCGQPWRLTLALQADGFWWRDEIIWYKKSCMPSSQRDRCTRAHEAVLMFSRAERYYYDHEAIKEPYEYGRDHHRNLNAHESHAPGMPRHTGLWQGRDFWNGSTFDDGKHWHHEAEKRRSGNKERKLGDEYGRPGSHIGHSIPWEESNGRTKRSVWTVGPEPFSGAHYATYPTALIEPMVLAGTRPGDVILDPFFGTGTTGEVALRMGRSFIGIDIDERNERFQRQRTCQTGMVFA